MSFRAFIYYCALCGAWAALLGWVLGRLIARGDSEVASAGLKGMFLGMLVALALGIVDALWVFSLRQVTLVAPRVLVAVVVGVVGGLIGGVLGQLLYTPLKWAPILVFGWTITGLLVGASLGVLDVLSHFVQHKDLRGVLRKLVNGAVGGAVGGFLGGLLSVLFKSVWGRVFGNDLGDRLWSPSATGFVALGACIGLMIGLAQVILREGWLRIEQGFRAGREVLLTKPEVTIGRAESCDIGLFGDPAVERLHARILRQGARYLVSDAGTTGGTYVNEQRIDEPVALASGDAIRIGKCVLRFGERQKRR